MHVLIVGAGIAGLTAAIALRHKGIDATIIEQAPRLSEIGAGIQIAANGSVVLRELGLEQAVAVLNRLREDLAATPVPVNGQLLRVSATFGVTEVQEGDAELEDILKRADRALYEGKGAGRNRVMTA